ncbi:MAG: serine hydrolase domain-containing protein [Pseudomonadales bacterium]
MRTFKIFMASMTAIVAWTIVAAGLAISGWWINSTAERGNSDEFFDWAVNEINTKNNGVTALMLIEDGAVTHRFFKGDADEETLFPTASFSKWITALSVMSLVEQKLVDLDAPVSQYLSRWRLPDSAFDNAGVTVRRLLSHTAGLTDQLGFGDYKRSEVLPSLEDELRNPRASSGAGTEIIVGQEPGSEFLYSGGGYLILQLLVEELTGVEFADYVTQTILKPLEMSRSSYEYLGDLENVAPSYKADGSLAPTYQYASAAATAFASSASDLSKLVIALLNKEKLPLNPNTIVEMREPHGFVLGSGIWGLGTILYVQAPNGDFVFGHEGANDPAINTSVRINPETSDGFIMLATGHPTLPSNIGSEWTLWQTGYPDFLSTERALKSAVAPILVGIMFLVPLIAFLARRRPR